MNTINNSPSLIQGEGQNYDQLSAQTLYEQSEYEQSEIILLSDPYCAPKDSCFNEETEDFSFLNNLLNNEENPNNSSNHISDSSPSDFFSNLPEVTPLRAGIAGVAILAVSYALYKYFSPAQKKQEEQTQAIKPVVYGTIKYI